MNAIKRFVIIVPAWAFGLVLVAFTTNSLYLYYKYHFPEDNGKTTYENGNLIVDMVKPGSFDEEAGLVKGDTIVAFNAYSVDTWISDFLVLSARDSVNLTVIRDNQEVVIPVRIATMGTNSPGFIWTLYLIMLIFNVVGLYIFYRKPGDRTRFRRC